MVNAEPVLLVLVDYVALRLHRLPNAWTEARQSVRVLIANVVLAIRVRLEIFAVPQRQTCALLAKVQSALVSMVFVQLVILALAMLPIKCVVARLIPISLLVRQKMWLVLA